MTIKLMHPTSLFEEVNSRESFLSLLDRYYLMCSHPRKIVFDLIGSIWGAYFLWNQNWPLALGVFWIMWGLGLFFTRNIDPELMSQTTIGKIGLLHKHPINFSLNLVGLLTFIYGILMHSTETILVGSSVMVLGHFFGWSKVNAKLRMS